MNIGQAADSTGVSAKRIRYYEQVGLIGAAERSTAGYRVYAVSDLHTLKFIQRCRLLGFSIVEIGTLLALWRDRRRSSADVKRVALAHVGELRTKIAELQSMVDTLQDLADHCEGNSRPDCLRNDRPATMQHSHLVDHGRCCPYQPRVPVQAGDRIRERVLFESLTRDRVRNTVVETWKCLTFP